MLKFFVLLCLCAFAAAKPGNLIAAGPALYGAPLAAAPYYANPLTYSSPLAYSSSASYIRPAYASPYAYNYNAYNYNRSPLAYSAYPAAYLH